MGFQEVMTNEQLYSRNLSSVNSFKLSFLFEGRCLCGYTRSCPVQWCSLRWEMPPPPLCLEVSMYVHFDPSFASPPPLHARR